MTLIYRLFVVVTEIRGALLCAQARKSPLPRAEEFMARADEARSELWRELTAGIGSHELIREESLPATIALIRTVATSNEWFAYDDAMRRVARLASDVAPGKSQ